MATEEERAAQFRADQVSRYRNRAAFSASLTGDPVAASRVKASFAPLVWNPVDAWDAPPEDVEVPRPGWLGRVPGDIELPEHLKRSERG